jgi:LacI family transcriptional regulator
MRGIKVPEDVSIISFDNTLLSESCTPALTSVNISTREIAEKSFQLIVERINNPHMSTQRIYTASTIIERDSVRNIKNRKKSS